MYTENLVRSLSKSAYLSSYLKSVVKVKDDDEVIAMDEDS